MAQTDGGIREQVERIHASPAQAVIVVTGGGGQALHWLLATPGASRTLLEAQVPYAQEALDDYLGYTPDSAGSAETARAMAGNAYQRACRLAKSEEVLGLAATAALATDRPKKGDHRCFVAVQSCPGTVTYALKLVKGLRDRAGEEELVSRLVLRALTEAGNLESSVVLDLDPAERVVISASDYTLLLDRLLGEDVETVTVHPDGSAVADGPLRGGVLAGSFDPLHRGHEELAKVAAEMLGQPVTFELSVTNIDKLPLAREDVPRRVNQFTSDRQVVLTRAPRFYEKARLFPGCTFVIGWDTAIRLVDPSYYDDGRGYMIEALTEIGQLGCGFLVAGRADGDAFRTLDDVPVPPRFDNIFTQIPRAAFRHDVSSTELRVAARGAR